jgi:hypothetical protein
MSELTESKDHIDRKKIENRKLLDAAEMIVFALPIPDKSKLLCLYYYGPVIGSRSLVTKAGPH